MADHKVEPVDPNAVYGVFEGSQFPLDMYDLQLLAQGDSWFSLGSIPPGQTSNVIAELRLSSSAAVVNCARPSKRLEHMADKVAEPLFLRLLTGGAAVKWDAILISGGGNDLIDALSVDPAAPADQRLLLRKDERADEPAGGAGYLSEAGCATFDAHLRNVFGFLLRKRDGGRNKGVPLFLHNYGAIMPRPSPAGLGHGPWLQPALDRHEVPRDAWFSVSTALMDRLSLLLSRIVAENGGAGLHLVDTQSAPLALAVPTATGASGDWQNEIHPTREGYKKLAGTWRAVLDAYFAAGPA
jgi:hypothetical protein